MNSVRMIEFKQELEDLMSEHECLSINLIASQLNIHINKGTFFSEGSKTIFTKGPWDRGGLSASTSLNPYWHDFGDITERHLRKQNPDQN